MPTTSLCMNRRQFVTAVIASALPLFAMTPVIARAASSGDIPWYINGECYYNSSSVSSSGNYVNSYAFIQAPRTLPAGWLGAYSVLYNINGAAVASNISYSPSACTGCGTGTSAAKISGMSYRGLAYTYVYNQSSGGYYESGAVWSPYQTICPAPSVPKLTEKQGPNLPGAGSRDISWMLPSKPAVPGTARRERGP